MMLVKLLSFIPKAGFLPVVTEMARLAASLSLFSIILEEEAYEAYDPVSLVPSCSAERDPGPYPFYALPRPAGAPRLRPDTFAA